MKKVMIVAAALAVGTLLADGIESSNICGYQNIPVVEGYSMLTPTFENISGDKIDLTQLVMTGDGMEKCKGDIEVQIISAAGLWVGDYSYWSTTNKDHPTVGWYDLNNDEELVEAGLVFLEPGEAIFINNTQGEDVYLQCSGSVAFGCANPLPEGYMQTGNSSPVTIDLQDFVPAGDGMEKCKGDIEMQLMSPAGKWEGDFSYWSTTNKDHPYIGWYDLNNDEEFVEKESVFFTPGMGCFINNTQGEDVYMSVPNPLGSK